MATETKSLPERLMAVAIDLSFGPETQGVAQELGHMAQELEQHWVPVSSPDGVWDQGIPTTAQGIALARFLRGRGAPYAHVSKGGAGLPDDYLYVRLGDGYEGGIAPDGSTST